ncbi:biotin apo-protein ligase-like protein [Aaosphaeria arxii CBS 175.79]|uniref:Biotin apo-protein ligase-like protein n=1 Tax=Aaosphaeria arxii CBS 175.79 TaxID=1450172 RepID=A0A6A5XTG6_9PLEO|nr:biotin apo-protein ligase-like protein [Aaosphaeria arxii CBS 175.79]KAF2016209.1 biotin apo-protein ligase-like protein [Aaosphaeria arxii CBS 175.79]
MATKKMNVLVYSGSGTTTESVRHCIYTLRRLLSPTYVVIPVTSEIILKEPWSASCALLVFPGGADLGYCRTLNGEGNRRITQYVNRGGNYLGFCAGGYFGSAKCEFEVDDKKMAVVGDRELGFFPGICRGLAFAGFVYNSEAGARAVDLKIHGEALPTAKSDLPGSFKSYYNGGGVFVDAKKLESHGVEVLASYTEDLHVDSGDAAAAVVYRKVGEGSAILTGPHPEFAPANLTKSPKLPAYSEAIDAIEKTNSTRVAFMKLLLEKFGLKVNQEEYVVPPLSSLHLSSYTAADVTQLAASWQEIITVVDGEDFIKGENDVFQLEKQGAAAWGVKELRKAVDVVEGVLPAALTGKEDGEKDGKRKEILERIEYTKSTTKDQIIEHDKIVKKLILHDQHHPTTQQTPFFHHDSYYANLVHYHSKLRNAQGAFGKHLMYGEVVTSTNTLLEKNPSLLRNLPNGFTLIATTSIAARGRGSNVWIGPPGSLAFSTVIHHSFQDSQSTSVVFIQYLAAMAIVRGVKNYAPGYEKVSVKLKWPNDIYAQIPGSSTNPIVKIGGILTNSSYSGSSYDVVTGIGLNLANALPTTSLNQLATAAGLKAFTYEKLLASILASFEDLYSDFLRVGFSRDMEAEYYEAWLHTDQIVTLETHDGMKAKIKGITRDWGLLLAEELGWEDRPTGRIVQLQSDSNSFDFFKGLLRRKV